MKPNSQPKLIPPPPEPQPESLAGILLPYQQAWIADQSPVKVCEKGRRTGITWAEAGDAALTAADQNGANVYYLSYNYDVGKEFIDDVVRWGRRIDGVARQAKQHVWEEAGNGRSEVLAYSVMFASGYEVTALSSRPRSLRGHGRPREVAIIDEAAMLDDLNEALKAAMAFTMWGGRVHIISTHAGESNPFAELINDCRAGRLPYSVHRITLDDALDQGLYRAICRETGEQYSTAAQAAWREKLFWTYRENADEELLVIPSKGGGVFLPAALIERQMRDGIPVLRGKGPTALDQIGPALDTALRTLHPHFMSVFGVDFGRSGDLTVIWILQITQNTKRETRFIVELRDVEYEKQKEILFTIADRMRATTRFIGGAMDASGNGAFLAEVAGLRYGGTKEQPGLIAPVVMNIEFYRENFPKYKAAFEDDLITLPRDADVLADHRMIRMEKGVARVPDERNRDAVGLTRHGDSAIAGLLAYFASYQNRQEYAYITPGSQIPAAYDEQRRRDLEEDYRGSDRAWGTSNRRGHGFGRGSW